MRIRYKYKKSKEGFVLKNVKCPTCGSNHINWIEVVEQTSWSGDIKLLAECWSGDTTKDKPHHLFLIKINSHDLPIVEINKVKDKVKGGTDKDGNI